MVRTCFRCVVALWFCVGVLFAQGSKGQAWSVLSEGLGHENKEDRASAVHALGLIPDSARAREAAENALTDKEEVVRAAAATALGEMGAESSIPKLKAALRDEKAEVVFGATNALYKLKDPIAFEVFYSVLMGERKTGKSLTESQMDMLKDSKALAKVGFEQGIGFIPFAGIGYGVFKGLRRNDASPVRAGAAAKVAEDPDPKAAEALRKSAYDDKWLVRAAVASAIAKRGDPTLLDAIIPLMDDDNKVVRYTAAAVTIRLSAIKQ